MQTKILSSELKIGMFVSELDRPWIDTPFLLQGFLIEDQEQLGQLQKYCEFALVDWERSAQELQAAHPGHSPGGKPASATSAPIKQKETLTIQKKPVPQKETFDFNQYRSGFDEPIENVMNVNPVRPSFIPESVELTTYSEVSPVKEELAPANKAYTRIGKVANDLILDVSSGKPLDLEQVNTVIPDVVSSMIRNPDALMWITRLRKQDDVTYGHGLQVAVYLIALGRHLGLLKDYLERLGTAGLLLDLGKIRLPQEVLQKNGHLSAKEFDIIKSHVRLSLDIADTIPNLHPDIRAGIAQHHERVNGSGYPEKLSRNQISLFSCMTGIVDSFVALTNPRPYSEAMPTHEALTSMKNWGGKFYHSDLVEQFTQAIGIFPIGSMVELSSGEVSVIISHSKTNRLKPRVLVISDADKNPLPQPVILDLSNQPQETDEPPPYILRGLPTNAYKLDAGEHYLTWPTTARRLKTKPLPKR